MPMFQRIDSFASYVVLQRGRFPSRSPLSLSVFLFAQPVIFLDSIVYFCVCFEQYAHAVATTAAEAVASIREKKGFFFILE